MFYILKAISTNLRFFIKRNYISSKVMRMMNIETNKIFVWIDESGKKTESKDSNIQIIFDYMDPNGQLRRISLKRPYFEEFSKTKYRLITKLSSVKSRKEKNTEELTNEEKISIEPDGININDETKNHEVFYSNNCSCINIGSTAYHLVKDIPYLAKIAITTTPIIGCPVIPSLDWQIKSIKFSWFISEKNNSAVPKKDGLGKIIMKDWLSEHLGKYLAVVADLEENFLLMAATTTTSVISLGNDEFIFEENHQNFCSTKTEGNNYRLCSYNILANLYLDFKQNPLFFPYCPVEYQQAQYRYPILLKEIKGYNADLLFLQEVDQRMQSRFLTNFLKFHDYSCFYKSKANVVNEGLMIAFKNDRFKLIETDNLSVRVSDLLDLEVYPENEDIYDYLKNTPFLYEKFITRPTPILVANTHLIFDPEFGRQNFFLCIRHLAYVRKTLKHDDILTLFAGDFNSTENSKAIQIVQGGTITAQDPVWNGNGLLLKGDVPYLSLAGFPKFTNFTKANGMQGFIGCLDYIWGFPKLNVNRVAPMANIEKIKKHGALPSKVASSDHLPLICEVEII